MTVVTEQVSWNRPIPSPDGATDRIQKGPGGLSVRAREGKFGVTEPFGQADRVAPRMRGIPSLDVFDGPAEPVDPTVDTEKDLVVAGTLADFAHSPIMTWGCDNP